MKIDQKIMRAGLLNHIPWLNFKTTSPRWTRILSSNLCKFVVVNVFFFVWFHRVLRQVQNFFGISFNSANNALVACCFELALWYLMLTNVFQMPQTMLHFVFDLSHKRLIKYFTVVVVMWQDVRKGFPDHRGGKQI